MNSEEYLGALLVLPNIDDEPYPRLVASCSEWHWITKIHTGWPVKQRSWRWCQS